jgi:hypothetical protein
MDLIIYRSLGIVLLILYLATQRLAFAKCYTKSVEGRNFLINSISTKMFKEIFVGKNLIVI